MDPVKEKVTKGASRKGEYSVKHVIASSEGAWQSRGYGVYSEQQNRDCFVAVVPRNDKKERASLNIYQKGPFLNQI